MRGLLSFAFSAAAAWAWCAAVFCLLGFALSETVLFAVYGAALSLLSAAEAWLSRAVRAVRPSGPAGAACTAFFIAAAAASFWIDLLGERRLAPSNAADILLAALAVGVPSGLLSYWCGIGAGKAVDGLLRILRVSAQKGRDNCSAG